MSRLIHVNSQTFNVPCRRFTASLTISKSERLPLVKEFALRLIYVHMECDVSELNEFFSFTERELSILVKDLCDAGLVKFEDGLLSLTEATRNKFDRSQDGLPHISMVEPWIESFAIDFISFSLLHFENRPDGFRVFHDLESSDMQKVSQSKDIAKEVLAGSFYEYVEKYKKSISADERSGMSIYGISAVEPRDAFSFPLRVDFSVEPGSPGRCNHSYPDFQSEADQERRERIVQAVAMKLEKSNGAAELLGSGHRIFIEAFDDRFYSNFFKGEKLLISELLQHYLDSGDSSYDEKKTTAFIGGFTKHENREILLDNLSVAIAENYDGASISENSVFWGKPTNELWLRDTESVELVTEVGRNIGKAMKQRPDFNLVMNNRFENHKAQNRRLRLSNNHHLFQRAYALNLSAEMASCEVIIVPGYIAVVNYYYSEPGYDLPIPLGFVTRDRDRLETITSWAVKEWAGFGRKVDQVWCSKTNPRADSRINVEPREAFSGLMAEVNKKPTKGRPTLTLQRDD